MRGRIALILGLTFGSALPAGLVWGCLGLILVWLVPSTLALVLLISFSAIHGIAEVMGLPLRPPSSSWQVPASWVASASSATRVAVWGVILGPGLVTRNPVAGMWVFPLTLVLVGDPFLVALLGVFAGLAHGTFRAIGILMNLREPGEVSIKPWSAMLVGIRWRRIDGAALSMIFGVSLSLFMTHVVALPL